MNKEQQCNHKNGLIQNVYLVWNQIFALVACCIAIILWFSLCKYKQLSFRPLRGIDTNISMQHVVEFNVIYLCQQYGTVLPTWNHSFLQYPFVHHTNVQSVLNTNIFNTKDTQFLKTTIHSHCRQNKSLSQEAIFSLLHQFQSFFSLSLKKNQDIPYFIILDWQKNQEVMEDRLYLSDKVGAFVLFKSEKSLTSNNHLQKMIEILHKFWFFTLSHSRSPFDFSVKTNFIFTLASDRNNEQLNWNFIKDVQQTRLHDFFNQLRNVLNFSIFSKIKQSSRLQNLMNPFIMPNKTNNNFFFNQKSHKLLNEIQNIFESPEHNFNFLNDEDLGKSYHLGVWLIANNFENKLKFCSEGKSLLTKQTLIHPTIGFLVVIPPDCAQQNGTVTISESPTEMTQSQVHTVAEFWVAHIRQKLGLEPSKVLSSQLVKELKCVEAYSISPTHKVNKRTEYETVRCVNNIPFGDQSYDQPLYIIAEIPPKAGFCQWELRQLQRLIIETETIKSIKALHQLASVRHIFKSTNSPSHFSKKIHVLIQNLLDVITKSNMLTVDRLNEIRHIQYSLRRIVESELWLEGILEPFNYILGIYTPLVLPCIIIFVMLIISFVKFKRKNIKFFFYRWIKKKEL